MPAGFIDQLVEELGRGVHIFLPLSLTGPRERCDHDLYRTRNVVKSMDSEFKICSYQLLDNFVSPSTKWDNSNS